MYRKETLAELKLKIFYINTSGRPLTRKTRLEITKCERKIKQHEREVAALAKRNELAAPQRKQRQLRMFSKLDHDTKTSLIKQNPLLIEFAENPSEELQMLAVTKNGLAIRHIENPSEDVQMTAILQNPLAINEIKNPPKELVLAAGLLM